MYLHITVIIRNYMLALKYYQGSPILGRGKGVGTNCAVVKNVNQLWARFVMIYAHTCFSQIEGLAFMIIFFAESPANSTVD